MRTKLSLSLLLAAIVSTAGVCAIHLPPGAPQTFSVRVHVIDQDGHPLTATVTTSGATPEHAGIAVNGGIEWGDFTNVNWTVSGSREGYLSMGLPVTERGWPVEVTLTLTRTTPPPPPAPVYPFGPESGPVTRDGKYFRDASAQVWGWRGADCFLCFARFLRGEDVTPKLVEARMDGANVLRVFGRVNSDPGKGWDAWMDYKYPERRADFETKLGAFFDLAAEYGLRVEYTVLTYPDDTNLQRQQVDQAYRVMAGRWNVFGEIANEASRQGIDAIAAAEGLNRRGVLTSSGYTEVLSRDEPRPDVPAYKVYYVPALGDYLALHDHDRGAEWPRKSKDNLEVRDGWNDALGRLDPAPARPVLNDEPIGAAEVDIPGRRSTSASDFAAYFAVCRLFSAGCTYHSDAGLEGRARRPDEVKQTAAAKAILDVWKFIPAAAQACSYTRGGLSFPLAWTEGDSLRDYGAVCGRAAWLAIVRPKPGRVVTPIDGWQVMATTAGGWVLRLER